MRGAAATAVGRLGEPRTLHMRGMALLEEAALRNRYGDDVSGGTDAGTGYRLRNRERVDGPGLLEDCSYWREGRSQRNELTGFHTDRLRTATEAEFFPELAMHARIAALHCSR